MNTKLAIDGSNPSRVPNQQVGISKFSTSATLGGLAQLARAPALQAGGHRFKPDILHKKTIGGVEQW